jgi:MFS family permease
MRWNAAWRSGPLSLASFRLLTAGQLTSNIGDYCYAVALPWLVLSGHGSTVLLGALLACYGVPRTVLILVGGMLADKISPRTTMLIADGSRCVFVAVFTVLAARHTVSLAALGPLAALIGAGEGLFIPASFAILPSLLDSEALMAGNAFFGAGQQTGSLIGPAVGGALVAGFGPVPALAVDAATFGLSALMLALIRPAPVPVSPVPASPAAPAGPQAETAGAAPDYALGSSAAAGGVLELLRTSRALPTLLVISLAANLAGAGLSEVALPDLAHQRWAASGYGALLTCLAVGSLLGTLSAAKAGGLRRPMVVTAILFVAMSAALGLVPYLGGLAGAAAAMLVWGLCNGLGNTIDMPALQRAVPARLLGRTMSVLMLCSFGTAPLSVLVAGVLVRRIGPSPFFPIAAALVAVAVLAGLTQREWRDFGACLTADLRLPS